MRPSVLLTVFTHEFAVVILRCNTFDACMHIAHLLMFTVCTAVSCKSRVSFPGTRCPLCLPSRWGAKVLYKAAGLFLARQGLFWPHYTGFIILVSTGRSIK